MADWLLVWIEENRTKVAPKPCWLVGVIFFLFITFICFVTLNFKEWWKLCKEIRKGGDVI